MDAKLTGGTELTQFNGKVVLDGILNASIIGIKEGIPVGLGIDTACPFVVQYDYWREVNYLNKMADVPLKKVLWIATHENARALRTMEDVFIKGERLHQPKNKKNKMVEEALDNISF